MSDGHIFILYIRLSTSENTILILNPWCFVAVLTIYVVGSLNQVAFSLFLCSFFPSFSVFVSFSLFISVVVCVVRVVVLVVVVGDVAVVGVLSLRWLL